MDAIARAGLGLAARDEVQLSPVEFDACWELLRLGETPPTLALTSPGRSWPERHRILASAQQALRRRGLAEQSGLSSRIAGPLRLLARPDYHLDLRLQNGERDWLVGIGAAAGDYGVLAIQRGEYIALRPVRPARLAAEVVALAGPITPGVGRTVNVPAEVFDRAWAATTDGALWSMADHLYESGISCLDASSCAHMCGGVRTLGQIGAAVWTHHTPRLGPWVIGFHRTDTGHFLQLRTPERAGATITICPLEATGLTRLVEELLAQHEGGRS